jgi:hypothetical protein
MRCGNLFGVAFELFDTVELGAERRLDNRRACGGL